MAEDRPESSEWGGVTQAPPGHNWGHWLRLRSAQSLRLIGHGPGLRPAVRPQCALSALTAPLCSEGGDLATVTAAAGQGEGGAGQRVAAGRGSGWGGRAERHGAQADLGGRAGRELRTKSRGH